MSLRYWAVGFWSFVLSLANAWSASAPSWVYVATGTELKAPQFSALSPAQGDFLLGGAFNASTGHLTRFSDEGALLWTTPLTVSSVGNGVGCGGVVGDGSGNQIAIFEFNGVLTVGASTFTTPSTGYGFAVVKFDPQGNVLWGQTVVGPSGISTYPAGLLRVDSQGNIYVFFAHTTSVAVGGISLSADAFGRSGVVKFNAAGTLQWARDYSSSGNQGYVTIDSIAVDDSSVFVTGFFNKYVGWGNTNITASAVTSFVGR